MLGGSLDWGLIREGAIIGVVAVIIDEVLKASSGKRMHLPPLAIGMGIYLPMEATLFVPIGAVLGWFYNRWAMSSRSPEFAERMGGADIEDGRDLSFVLAMSNEAAITASSQGKRERIKQDGFAGAGFTGQH